MKTINLLLTLCALTTILSGCRKENITPHESTVSERNPSAWYQFFREANFQIVQKSSDNLCSGPQSITLGVYGSVTYHSLNGTLNYYSYFATDPNICSQNAAKHGGCHHVAKCEYFKIRAFAINASGTNGQAVIGEDITQSVVDDGSGNCKVTVKPGSYIGVQFVGNTQWLGKNMAFEADDRTPVSETSGMQNNGSITTIQPFYCPR